MPRSTRTKRLVGVVTALALAGGLLTSVTGGTPAEAKATAYDAKAEAARMDAIAAPTLDWFECAGTVECATASVPLDYDQPNGAKVQLALTRHRATGKRIGTLFVNPGGPGGYATDLPLLADFFFSPKLLENFDIVGMDPRGVGYSQNVECLDFRSQIENYNAIDFPFPTTDAQIAAWQAADKTEGAACSANTLATSMSTTEVARDMELMRRSVGDAKLTYLGWSYGTYLGQVYANMFPNRFRAVAVDGVIDPVAWAGDNANKSLPLELRLNAGGGAWKAMRTLLTKCDQAGGEECSFATGDPVAKFTELTQRLKAHPLTDVDIFTGEEYTYGYADFIGEMLGALYYADAPDFIPDYLTYLYQITEPPAAKVAAASSRSTSSTLAKWQRLHREIQDRVKRPTKGFPYYNGIDVFASVTCTDSLETTPASLYPAYAAQADEKSPHFGRLWLWNTSICAGDVFTGNDEDVYTGPFDTQTAKPVLFVGNYYDPATNYAGAVSASKRMPNARLLRSNSWGHTAYGTSDCVTNAMDNYLVKGTLPKEGKRCTGDVQPFDGSNDDATIEFTKAKIDALKNVRNPFASLGR